MPEGDAISSIDLVKEWAETLTFFDQMISNGQKIRSIRFLIRHIIEHGYNTKLYPGTSMYSLLISFPMESKINYTKTLKIDCDQLRSHVKYSYRDYSGLDRQLSSNLNKALIWEDICQPTEVIGTFEYFLKEIVVEQNLNDIV